MHHDESLHATYAWYLFQGLGYHYDPVMHGPLQFYVMAFFYLLFGDSEASARLFAVLCGSVIVFLPYFLRRDMGRAGALIASVALAVSPAFMYYSRFARDDILLEFFSHPGHCTLGLLPAATSPLCVLCLRVGRAGDGHHGSLLHTVFHPRRIRVSPDN